MDHIATSDIVGKYGFIVHGDERAILLIHGISGAPNEMKLFARPFIKAGYTVICPQIAGHCGTYQELKASKWIDWYLSLERALQFLTKNYQEVHIAGLSVGGLLGLKLARNFEESVNSVAVLSPTFFFDGWNISVFKRVLSNLVIHTPLRHFVSFKDVPPYGIKDPVITKLFTQNLAKNGEKSANEIGHMNVPATTFYEIKQVIKSLIPELSQIISPILIVQSIEDDLTSPKNAIFLKNRLTSTQVDCHFIDDCYHVIVMDKKRKQVAEKVLAFHLKAISHTPIRIKVVDGKT